MSNRTQHAEEVRFPMDGNARDRYVPLPAKTQDGAILGHAAQTILREPHELYSLWRNVKEIPRWQEFVVSVAEIDSTTSHWVMGDSDDADGKRVAFDSRITEDVPGAKISWESISKGVDLSGTVTFTAANSGRGTTVALIQRVVVPAGAFGNAIAAMLARSPGQIVIENLRHFKQLAESGEIPTVKGQPHGPRGISGGIKEWMYGETNPTPPGTSEQSQGIDRETNGLVGA